ncbi:tRNA lysidine(34) synthetase TilS [Novosphingobium marinum]|uniref:tRNA(Ile)-lysidine synthase n=1 Tax=Novosphingobium marinum TaxID=1514948 RepID=A0A7Y9Y032_9SPHN|nr:tRNA lysidine(34) synthetase TilS [Novosphingobium marinum]NYH96166.1 tRNA(Ile)-lysidine synthase [Novosphingobium marinum]
MPPAPGSTVRDDVPGVTTEQAGRFAASLASVWPEVADPHARIGIALSFGPDSTALLLLAAACLPGRVEAATVDHGLRAESADEARQAAVLCGDLGIPHEILAVTVAEGNLQSQARAARYVALGEWLMRRELAALATGHHADDQAETLLLRLNRGSGVAGLAGTRGRTAVPGTAHLLVRPLLDWRREELAGIVESAAIRAAADPSNADDRFDRARLRKALAGADWLDVSAVADCAANLADADAAIEWAARREWRECVRRDGIALVYRPQAPKAVALRVLSRMVGDLGGDPPRGGTVARVFEALVAGGPASIADLVVRPTPAGWAMTRAPKRRTSS